MNQHLEEAALALLADHEPSSAEQAHLAKCAECSARVAEYQRLATSLRALPDLPAPEGIREVVDGHIAGARLRPALPGRRVWMKSTVGIAAALTIFVGGYYVGRAHPAASSASVDAGPGVDVVANHASAEATLLTRAAALEAMTLTAEAALKDAPADPIILAHYKEVRRDRDLLRQRVQVVSRPARWF